MSADKDECFNGATFIQTWKRSPAGPSRKTFQPGFNGATFIQTWKPLIRSGDVIYFRGLQWSHVHSNVETRGFKS